MTIKKIIFITSLFLVMIVQSREVLLAEQNEVFEFQKTVIEGLGLAKEAYELNKSRRSDDDWEGVIADTIFAQNKIRKAANSLNRFSQSKNEFIKKGQEILEMAYLNIDLSYLGQVKFFEELLNGNKLKRGSNAIEMAQLGASMDESWKNLLYATIISTYSLIDDTRKVDNKTPYLVITKSQRDELIKDLEKYFGDTIKSGPKAGQHSTEAAVTSIYRTLMSQGFKMSDE